MSDDGQSDVAKREAEILSFWKEKGIFKKSLEQEAPNGEFVFYDGPPFATGLPHYGHILAGTIKDVIPRYKTMRGYHVSRRWGWDCHGLPLENQIEKELGLATKRDIEKLGVGKFNTAAQNAVLRYADDWKQIIPRFGRFVDMEDDYRTMDAPYTESVWWAFKNLHDKKLVYEGFKAMHLCPRCGTTLSNFEVAQGYKDITDLSVTVKLELKGEPKTYLLAWTTTPWTLPGNMAAAVNAEATYVVVRVGDEKYILGKDRLEVIRGEYVVEKELTGKELIGKSYTPPFSYFEAHKLEGKDRAWKVYGASYVTMDSGTGIVHLAPAFGAEDLELAQEKGIPIVHHVTTDGVFVPSVTDFAGLHAKPKEDSQSTDVEIIKYLAHKGLLFAKEKIVHSYPHCWRCDTPLLNYASSSWFVAVTQFKNKLVSENKKVHWVPKEVGEKRFGNWLENARDWAISRARYWGAPIPVWKNPKTKEVTVMGSLEELKKYVKTSGNTYFVMRHGEAQNNTGGVISGGTKNTHHLTEKGKQQVLTSAQGLKRAGIDMIVVSPLVRTQETAQIVQKVLELPASAVISDDRLKEGQHGSLDGKPVEEFWKAVPTISEWMVRGAPGGGESYADIMRRMGGLLYELERKHQGKKILLVSHDDPIHALCNVAEGKTKREIIETYVPEGDYYKNAEVREVSFVPIPHNEDFELDFHRPFIDEVDLVAKDGTRLERVADVFDCWFESGSMAYAQHHYPFKKDVFDPKGGWFKKAKGFPADFIAEGLDQTRGWFYSLLVLGVGLFGRTPYQSVIVNGTVLDETGSQKLSKKLKNYPDPVEVLEKYGADAVRYYMLASPLTRGEDLSFSEKGVAEVANKLIGRFLNILSFYELYKDDIALTKEESAHSLDRWILSRLNETVRDIEKGIDTYELDRATRPLMSFVEDLSTWYVRRSRERLRAGGDDASHALTTLRAVLETCSRAFAPIIPFTAEYVYQKVREEGSDESVHLTSWPSVGVANTKLQEDMELIRKSVTLGLEARQKATIKVRQPLAKLSLHVKGLEEASGLFDLVKDEVNVKEVVVDVSLPENTASLDTVITQTLQEEGNVREVVRFIQDLRKQKNLSIKDEAVLLVSGSGAKEFVEKHWKTIQDAARLKSVEEGGGSELALEGITLSLDVRKY